MQILAPSRCNGELLEVHIPGAPHEYHDEERLQPCLHLDRKLWAARNTAQLRFAHSSLSSPDSCLLLLSPPPVSSSCLLLLSSSCLLLPPPPVLLSPPPVSSSCLLLLSPPPVSSSCLLLLSPPPVSSSCLLLLSPPVSSSCLLLLSPPPVSSSCLLLLSPPPVSSSCLLLLSPPPVSSSCLLLLSPPPMLSGYRCLRQEWGYLPVEDGVEMKNRSQYLTSLSADDMNVLLVDQPSASKRCCWRSLKPLALGVLIILCILSIAFKADRPASHPRRSTPNFEAKLKWDNVESKPEEGDANSFSNNLGLDVVREHHESDDDDVSSHRVEDAGGPRAGHAAPAKPPGPSEAKEAKEAKPGKGGGGGGGGGKPKEAADGKPGGGEGKPAAGGKAGSEEEDQEGTSIPPGDFEGLPVYNLTYSPSPYSPSPSPVSPSPVSATPTPTLSPDGE
eukprot:g21780.t1